MVIKMRTSYLKPIHSYDGTFKNFVNELITNQNLSDSFKTVNDLTSCPIDGAYLTLSKIESLVILFHSPQGCSTSLWFLWGGAFSLKSIEASASRKHAITLSTNLNETDIVYGAEEKLKKALLDIKEKYNPKYVAVLSSCCSGIIGENIESIVKEMSKTTDMNIGWLDTSGFKSWYWPNGYDYAHNFIVNNILPDKEDVQKTKEKTINIITYGNAAAVDEKECERLICELGIKAFHPFEVPYTSIENLQKSASSHLNFMMCKTYGFAFCEAMKKKYGMPYIQVSHPMSTYYTEKWIREIAAFFNIEEKGEAVILSEKKKTRKDLLEIKKQLGGKSVAISAGHDKVPALLSLVNELGLTVIYLGVLTYDNLSKDKFVEMEKQLNYDFITLVNPQTYEELTVLNELKPDVYIGPAGLTPKVNEINIPALSVHFNDFIGSFFGFQGVINFGKYILRGINTKGQINYKNDSVYPNEKICGQDWFKKGVSICKKTHL